MKVCRSPFGRNPLQRMPGQCGARLLSLVGTRILDEVLASSLANKVDSRFHGPARLHLLISPDYLQPANQYDFYFQPRPLSWPLVLPTIRCPLFFRRNQRRMLRAMEIKLAAGRTCSDSLFPVGLFFLFRRLSGDM